MMMGKLDNWILRLVPVYVLWFFVFLKSASASEDFVSIACCADSNYTDPVTKINYTSDYSWFSDRTCCRNISNRELNHTEYHKARKFELDEGKRCYSLPTIKGEVYLLRAIFPVNNTLRETAYSLFGVLIGVSEVGSLRSFQDGEIEGVFRATKTYIDFCLVKEDGNPFVSQIELRSLDEEYLQGLNPSISKLISRVNLGATEDDIRYPDDPSDRIWKANSSTSAVPISFSVNISNHNANMTPPLKVLQTAITHPDRLEFIKNDLDKGSAMYRVFLYFLELNGTFRSGQRVFDIYVNGEIKEKSFDILAGGSNYRYTVLNTSANRSVNITLIKASSSEFGPLCNAYEIMQLQPWMEETNQTDLEVILKVKAELLVQNQGNKVLESWSGDPCLPSPWQGVGCDHPLSSAPIISNLDLSSSDLQGPIPPSVTQLANLKILNLSHNTFNGNIPSFPSSSLLISIDLSNNELMGSLSESITDLSHLKSLYFGCNKDISKTAPANLNSSVNTDHGRCKCKESQIQKHIIIGTVTGGSILIILAVGILVLCRYRGKLTPRGGFSKNKYPMATNLIYSLPSKDDFFVKSVSIQAFTLKYIEAATERYKTLIGEGGFGSVYRGILDDGQEVAVKVRSATSTQGTREFENELNLLTAIRHENLVPLLGYCCENDQQILVYPFMSNGSLQDRLYGEAAKRKVLDWPTRLSIALGAAQGLLYLHTFDRRSVIHRDVKPSNILMDHSMCAKVADFGFSKYAPQEGDSNASLEVRGTAGYMDPEYYTTQQLSAKSDVFSFGVVLLEIVSGREPLNIHRPRNEWSLVEWAKPYVRASKIDEIVDPGIKGGYHAEAMWRVVESALSCVEPISANRPSMADIVRELEDALIIENNASEYMKSIESQGSNRYSIVLDKRVLPPTPSSTESTITTQTLSLPQPR